MVAIGERERERERESMREMRVMYAHENRHLMQPSYLLGCLVRGTKVSALEEKVGIPARLG